MASRALPGEVAELPRHWRRRARGRLFRTLGFGLVAVLAALCVIGALRGAP